jgi:plasmid maintenance system antidote protein VapI
MPVRFLLRSEFVRDLLNRRHWSHHRTARHLGISAAYFSQLLNRRRALTPDMRHLLLSSQLFADVPETELWDCVPDDDGGAP